MFCHVPLFTQQHTRFTIFSYYKIYNNLLTIERECLTIIKHNWVIDHIANLQNDAWWEGQRHRFRPFSSHNTSNLCPWPSHQYHFGDLGVLDNVAKCHWVYGLEFLQIFYFSRELSLIINATLYAVICFSQDFSEL